MLSPVAAYGCMHAGTTGTSSAEAVQQPLWHNVGYHTCHRTISVPAMGPACTNDPASTLNASRFLACCCVTALRTRDDKRNASDSSSHPLPGPHECARTGCCPANAPAVRFAANEACPTDVCVSIWVGGRTMCNGNPRGYASSHRALDAERPPATRTGFDKPPLIERRSRKLLRCLRFGDSALTLNSTGRHGGPSFPSPQLRSTECSSAVAAASLAAAPTTAASVARVCMGALIDKSVVKL